jgi:HD-like signal output (HDOD) protein
VLDLARSSSLEVTPDQVSALMDKYQAEVGTVLADHWHLPTAVRHTINGVDIDVAAEGSQEIVDTVKAARVFAAYTMADRHYDADSLTANPYIVEINLYADDIQRLLDKADSVHDTIGALSL